MDADTARQYLLGKPEAMEDYPFGPDVAVMKVRDKMFATLGQEGGEGRMNLKCDPDQAHAGCWKAPCIILSLPGWLAI